MGNAKGLVSYARGKGSDYEIAMENGMKNLKENVLPINVDAFQALVAPMTVSTNGFIIKVWPRPYQRAWGHPLTYMMLNLIGL